jgi:hypothetical protein
MAPDRDPQVGNIAEISVLLVERCVIHVRLTVHMPRSTGFSGGADPMQS